MLLTISLNLVNVFTNMRNGKTMATHIAVRTDGLERMLQRWSRANPGTTTSHLIRSALLAKLRPFARKRDAETYRAAGLRRIGRRGWSRRS